MSLLSVGINKYGELITYKVIFMLGNFWGFVSFLSMFSGRGRRQGKAGSKVTCACVVGFQHD